MTTKRTHGPCTCGYNILPVKEFSAHSPDCSSLYPAQQEPDALTKITRLVRILNAMNTDPRHDAILSLISEAREEQRKASVRATSKGLEDAAEICEGFGCPCAKDIRYLKDPEP